MKKGKVTILDIAKELNVTPSTVSRALKDHPRISKATKVAVLRVSKRLNYQPNHIAAALRRGKSNIIGIIVPNVDRSFFSSVVYGIEEIANASGYNVMICQSHEDFEMEVAAVEVLLNTRVDGIIASHAKTTRTYEHFKKVRDRGIPLVLFDRSIDNLGVSHVVIDDFVGAYQAVEHLIEQGSRRITHFTGIRDISIYRERFRGYTAALKAHNIPLDQKLVVKNNMQLEDGVKSMRELLDSNIEVDGLFSASAFGAMGALQVCKERNIRVPQDIAIVGFSNEIFTSFTEPSLTSVEQHSLQMGNAAAKMFFDLAKSKALNDTMVPQKLVLTPTLIIRESSVRNPSESNLAAS